MRPWLIRAAAGAIAASARSEEHTSELQSQSNLVCRLLLEKKQYRTTWTSVHSDSGGTRWSRGWLRPSVRSCLLLPYPPYCVHGRCPFHLWNAPLPPRVPEY